MIRLSKSSISDSEIKRVTEILRAEFLGTGPETAAFEQDLRTFIGGIDTEVVCVNTGTSALHLALEALDIGPGDEVLVPSLTYVASYQAISATGATPISCDVKLADGLLNLDDARKRLTKRTKAIMPVHYASNSAGTEAVYDFAKEHLLRVVEDAAHSFGNYRAKHRIGALGDIVCFSFDGIKNITSGEGGAVVTRDKLVANRVRDARLLGVERDSENRANNKRSWVFDVSRQGFRYHMSDVMAAIGREQLKRFEDFAKNRQCLLNRYVSNLKTETSVKLLDINTETTVAHIFAVRIPNQDTNLVRAEMENYGIQTGLHYFPNHKLSLYRTNYALPATEQLCSELITLPLHNDLSTKDVDYVCGKLLQVVCN